MTVRIIMLAAMKREAEGSVFHQETLLELERLYAIEDAARALWDAHCKSHDRYKHGPGVRDLDPRKYGMNYGELVQLAEALGLTPEKS